MEARRHERFRQPHVLTHQRNHLERASSLTRGAGEPPDTAHAPRSAVCGGKQVRVTRRADMGRRKGGLHGGTTFLVEAVKQHQPEVAARLLLCRLQDNLHATRPIKECNPAQARRRWRRRFALWCGHHHIVIVIALVDAEAARGLIRSLIAVCDSSVSSSLCAASTLPLLACLQSLLQQGDASLQRAQRLLLRLQFSLERREVILHGR